MSSKRILVCGPNLTATGGIASVLRTFMDYVDEEGGGDFDYFDTSRYGRHRSAAASLFSFKRSVSVIFLAIRYAALLIKNKYSLVMVNTSSYWGYWEKAVLVVLARLFRKKAVLVIHGGEFEKFYRASKAKRWIVKVMRIASGVIFVSKETLEKFRQRGVRAVYLPNPVEDPIKDLGGEVSTRKDKKVTFLSLSLLEPRKRVLEIIDAFKEFKKQWNINASSPVLKVCGSGPLEKLVAQEAARVGGVEFVGPVRGSEKARQFREADVVVNNSERESFGLVILEAMIAERLLLSTSVGVLKDNIEGGAERAYLKVNDTGVGAQDFHRAAQVLLNEDERDATISAARDFAAQYSAAAVMPRWVELLRRIAREP